MSAAKRPLDSVRAEALVCLVIFAALFGTAVLVNLLGQPLAPVSVSLVAPVAGAIVSNTITLQAEAATTAPGASIWKVELYADDKLVGTVTNRPARVTGVRVQ